MSSGSATCSRRCASAPIMAEKGMSQLVSVELSEAQEFVEAE